MPGLSGIHHVKLPVSDVARSREWYRRVLGFEPELDFVEAGVLMGVSMVDQNRSLRLALRSSPGLAAALRGFDPIALAVTTRSQLEAWACHLETLGEPSDGLATGKVGWVITGLRDPDGIEVRLYTLETRREETS